MGRNICQAFFLTILYTTISLVAFNLSAFAIYVHIVYLFGLSIMSFQSVVCDIDFDSCDIFPVF